MINELDRLIAAETQTIVVRADGSTTADFDVSGSIVLAGSFNPLHYGHRRLLEAAEAISGRQGIFEMSIENVDKPDLPRAEIERRIVQFSGIADVALTRARLFSDKAALLPGAWFVVGIDTAVRLIDDRYYKDGDARADMQRLFAAGVRFLVAGRADVEGVFQGLESLDIPPELAEMFVPIPESVFREDVSSTSLREQRPR